MAKQPELVLEEQLVSLLTGMGYSFVSIKDEKDLLINLKQQLEKHNQIQFTDKEFERVLNILSKGTVFEKAKTLREKQHMAAIKNIRSVLVLLCFNTFSYSSLVME